MTYFQTKQLITDYQVAKCTLLGAGGLLSGWIRGGAQWESFNVNGECGIKGNAPL
jgi:hypothetical protein